MGLSKMFRKLKNKTIAAKKTQKKTHTHQPECPFNSQKRLLKSNVKHLSLYLLAYISLMYLRTGPFKILLDNMKHLPYIKKN